MSPVEQIIQSNNELIALLKGIAQNMQELTSEYETNLGKW